MRRLNMTLGILTVVVGFGIASWGPAAFEIITGRNLPIPLGSDPVAMTIWSGVAFVRVFGAVLLGLGAVLWAANVERKRDIAIHAAVCISATFAGLIILAQQIAIWSNTVGFWLVAILATLALASGLKLLNRVRDNATA